VQHVVVVLHECWRAPGTGEQLEPVATRGHRTLDERDLELEVVRDRERFERSVALVDVGVAAAREVATVDVGSGEGVSDPALGIVVRCQHLSLLGFRQFRERLRRGVGEGATDAQESLEGLPWIDEDVDTSLRGGFGRPKDQCIGGRHPEVGVCGGGIDNRARAGDIIAGSGRGLVRVSSGRLSACPENEQERKTGRVVHSSGRVRVR
jgi:hypothetical protein